MRHVFKAATLCNRAIASNEVPRSRKKDKGRDALLRDAISGGGEKA